MIALLGAAGCVPPPGGYGLSGAERDRAAAEALELQIGHFGAADFKSHLSYNGSVTFRNFHGNSQGMDGDVDIRFYPDGKVRIAANSMGIQSYVGIYAADDNGKVLMTRRKPGEQFPEIPAMMLSRGDRGLLLRPHGAAEVSAFWCFRMIPPREKSHLND